MHLLWWILLALLCPQWLYAADSMAWQPVFGDAASLTGTAETVYAVGQDGTAWQWQKEDGFWGRLPGAFKSIKVTPRSNHLWGIGLDNQVLEFSGFAWLPLGFKALDIAPSVSGDLIWVDMNGALHKRLQTSKENIDIEGTANNIAMGLDGVLWKRSATGELSQLVGSNWQPIEGKVNYLGVDLDGSIVTVSEQGKFRRWETFSKSWRTVSTLADVKLATSGFNNTLWVAHNNGTLLAQGAISKAKIKVEENNNGSITINRRGSRGGGGSSNYGSSRRRASAAAYTAITPAASITDPDPFTFIDTRRDGKLLAISMEGSVFSIGNDQGVYQWSNAQQTFKSFPGTLTKIAVDPYGNPWGINQYGRIFRHNSTDWIQVTGLASDIAIGANGRVIIANETGELSEYDASTLRFKILSALSAYFVAVAKDGTPWGLLKDGTIVRCGQAPCERLPKQASSIAIGPDNSVFIVTSEGRLERYRATSDDWQIIPVNGLKVSQVAVGPKGRPWVVAEDGSILYSALFPRDESTDTQVATTTKTPTTGTGDTATVTETGTFVINKNLLFGSLASTLNVLSSVTVGQDGTVLGIGYTTKTTRGSDTTVTIPGTETTETIPGTDTTVTIPGTETTVTIPGTDTTVTIPAYEKYNSTTKKMVEQMVTLPNNDQFKTVKTAADGSLWFLSLGVNGRLYHKVNGAFTTVDVFQNTSCTVGTCMFETSLLDFEIAADGSLYVTVSDGSVYYKSATATKFSKLVAGNYRKVAVSRTSDVWLLSTGNELKQIVNGVAITRSLSTGETALDLAGSSNGNIYIVYSDGTTSKLARWNATSLTFDKVNRTASAVGVTPNGRPWVVDDSNYPNILFYAK